MNPVTPPPTRRYPYVYEAWRRGHYRPDIEPAARRRHCSADRNVFASLYEVPRQPAQVFNQPSSSSGWSDRHFHTHLPSNSASASNIRSRRHGEAVGTSGTRHQITTNLDNDIMYQMNMSKEEIFFQSVIQALQDMKLLNSDISPSLNIIPEFDPFARRQTINLWIQKMKLCREICDWSDKQTTYYDTMKLRGSVMTSYQSLPAGILSWEDRKKKPIEAFPTAQNYAVLLNEMLSVKAEIGDPLELYYHVKIALLHRCNISGKQAVDCLVYGVKDKNIRLAAHAAQFTEPHLVLKFFKTVE